MKFDVDLSKYKFQRGGLRTFPYEIAPNGAAAIKGDFGKPEGDGEAIHVFPNENRGYAESHPAKEEGKVLYEVRVGDWIVVFCLENGRYILQSYCVQKVCAEEGVVASLADSIIIGI